MKLQEYQAKRNFRRTPEPRATAGKAHARPIFVVQEHHASHLHYDFRLEADGVLKSWAVPKQLSLDPAQKRLAVQVEDHPLEYASFAGTIPEGQYGAGTVTIWDRGTYDNLLAEKPVPQTVVEGVEAGRLEFTLHGEKLQGRFALIRMRGKGRGKVHWLLIKMKDEFAQPEPAPAKQTSRPSRAPRATSRRGGNGKPAAELPAVTHEDRILFPNLGITKGEVFEFYRRIAPRLLQHLHNRPATLERLPEGVGGRDAPHFWQKNAPSYYPSWIPLAELETEQGKTVRYVLVNNLETLLYLVNQGTLTFHVWFSRVEDLDRPDFVLFDLDVSQATFADVVAVAGRLYGILQDQGVQAFLKTSGKNGLHVLTPWEEEGGYDKARAWALGIAGQVVEAMPDRATVERSKVKRGKRVYVDVMQNARGRHAVPPYVLRAVPAATVSTPLDWRELQAKLDPTAFNLRTIFERLKRKRRDPRAVLASRGV
jgi:bifunctional non-homologous end joining protein LigD